VSGKSNKKERINQETPIRINALVQRLWVRLVGWQFVVRVCDLKWLLLPSGPSFFPLRIMMAVGPGIGCGREPHHRSRGYYLSNSSQPDFSSGCEYAEVVPRIQGARLVSGYDRLFSSLDSSSGDEYFVDQESYPAFTRSDSYGKIGAKVLDSPDAPFSRSGPTTRSGYSTRIGIVRAGTT